MMTSKVLIYRFGPGAYSAAVYTGGDWQLVDCDGKLVNAGLAIGADRVARTPAQAFKWGMRALAGGAHHDD